MGYCFVYFGIEFWIWVGKYFDFDVFVDFVKVCCVFFCWFCVFGFVSFMLFFFIYVFIYVIIVFGNNKVILFVFGVEILLVFFDLCGY